MTFSDDRIPPDRVKGQGLSDEAGRLSHSRNMQLLRLIVSALAEGLAGDIASVLIRTAAREIRCRTHWDVMRFLYCHDASPSASDRKVRSGFRTNPMHKQKDRAALRVRLKVRRPIVAVSIEINGVDLPCPSVGAFLEHRLKPSIRERLGADFSEEKWEALGEELADSLLNEARALHAQTELSAALRPLMSRRGERTLFGFLTGCASAAGDLADLGHDTASLLVQIGSFNGHRFHPCTKTRLLDEGAGQPRRGLTTAEFDAFAPEAARDVALPVLAARLDRVTTSVSAMLGCDYAAYFAAAFPAGHRSWLNAVTASVGEGAAGRFVPIPVHPLQLGPIRAQLAGPIAAGEILLDADAHILQRPTISFRTLTPVHRPAEPQIKTTLAMLMTSEVRIISPARTYNAPVLSDLLLGVAARDPMLSGLLRVQSDEAAVSWGRDPGPASADYRQGFHLAVTLRRNPATLVGAREINIPLSALLTRSPVSGAILLAEIMREAGIRRGSPEAIAWFREHAEKVLTVTLGLLARYGISLEAHQQNTDLVFGTNGRVTGLIYRDASGGVEICEAMLAARGFEIRSALHPFIRNLSDSIELPLRQMMHTTLALHLFPVVSIIAHAFELKTQPLFAAIKEIILTVLSDARSQMAKERSSTASLFTEALAVIEHRILHAPIATKSLLTMRAAQSHDVSFVTIDNPLART